MKLKKPKECPLLLDDWNGVYYCYNYKNNPAFRRNCLKYGQYCKKEVDDDKGRVIK